MISKRHLMMILFVISCSIYATAQTDYYYGRYNSDKKIPLTLNENKVCVSIYKKIWKIRM